MHKGAIDCELAKDFVRRVLYAINYVVDGKGYIYIYIYIDLLDSL